MSDREHKPRVDTDTRDRITRILDCVEEWREVSFASIRDVKRGMRFIGYGLVAMFFIGWYAIQNQRADYVRRDCTQTNQRQIAALKQAGPNIDPRSKAIITAALPKRDCDREVEKAVFELDVDLTPWDGLTPL